MEGQEEAAERQWKAEERQWKGSGRPMKGSGKLMAVGYYYCGWLPRWLSVVQLAQAARNEQTS